MKLYRLMKPDADGKPLVGTGFGMLGVRPPGRGEGLVADIPVDADGNVRAGTDGLSTFATPLVADRKHAVWVIESPELTALAGTLVVVESPDTKGRYHIAPGRTMTLAEYQAVLAATRDLWQRQ